MVELSSLDIRHLAHELQQLEDAFVDKVYQTKPDEFLLRLRHRERGRFNLLLRPGAWAALSPDVPETPDAPSNFAMALRKALANARVRRVRQHEFDRVLVFELERAGEPFSLIVEFFGKGNLVVVDGQGVTQLASRTETFAHRTIRRGEPFKFPPARRDPADVSATELAALAKASKRDLVRFLAVDAGLGGDLAEACILSAGLDKTIKAAVAADERFDDVVEALRRLLAQPAAPRVLAGAKGPQLASADLPQWTDAGTSYASLSQAILAANQAVAQAEPERVDEEHARLERQLQHQLDSIERLGQEADAHEAAARSIYADYARFETLLGRIRQAVEADGWDALAAQAPRADSWPEVASVDPASKRVSVRWAERVFAIDPFQSVQANASLAFDQAKALRTKIDGALAAVEQTRLALARRQKAQKKEEAASKRERALTKRSHWFMAYRWFYTSEGFLVVGGRDAASNEKVVKKHLKPGDLYFHADVHGAPSCVLKTEGRTPGEPSLEEAARFAATYSKAFNQYATADAYWVTPEQVSKTAQSGEFVPKGAFIVRGTRHYRKDLPMEAGVGVVSLDKDGRPTREKTGERALMGGPWRPVAHHAEAAVRIVRGQAKASDIAKRVAQELDVPVDAVVAALPAGNLAVEEARR